jgi:hypothetical protein
MIAVRSVETINNNMMYHSRMQTHYLTNQVVSPYHTVDGSYEIINVFTVDIKWHAFALI